MKKKILIALACLLAILGVICEVYWPDSSMNNTIEMAQNTIIEEVKKDDVIVSEQTEELAIQTKEAVNSNKDISTTEIVEGSESEETEVTDEGALETDALVEQENISYNGDSTGNGLSLLGGYQGLTYYSQADSRWANVMFSSINDYGQTIKSSGCRSNKCCNGSKF